MNFSDIRNKLVEFPGEDSAKINSLIIDALQDICLETWIWTEKLTFLTTAGIRDYALTPSNSESEIIGIPYDGCQIASVYTPQPTASDGTGTGALTPATDYSYRVTAYRNDYGETLPCAVVTHECPASGVIALEWDAVAGADGYKIYGNNGAGTTYTLMTSTTSLSYDDDGTDAPDGSTEPPTESGLMTEIDQTANSSMKHLSKTWREHESDWITGLIFNGIDSVRTNRIPQTGGIAFQVEAALSPKSAFRSDIPGQIAPYYETILMYLRYRVYTFSQITKDNPWLNYKLGQHWQMEYLRARSRIKSRKMLGYGRPKQVKARRFV